ncbi:hypothetical protein [Prevotella sp.]|mgnify:FL=1|uniref:hypothetical protein n=1 Tax=Prevotella sp. TaxID=59823 RepID=UPI0025F3F3BA|nr:hypothetical protein [Prevotella sp.]
MKKTISTLFTLLLVLVLASCSDSSKEIEGFKFTGKGIFGEIPSMFAENAQMTKEGTIEDDYSKYQKLLDERESFEVECEVMKGKTITKGTINFKKDGNCYINENGSSARYASTLSEDVKGAFDNGEKIHVCGLDKDGVLITNYGPYNTYTLGGNFSGSGLKSASHGERNYKRYIRRLYNMDRIVKIVVTNDEGMTTICEKSAEARMKNLTEEEKTIGKGDLALFELKGNVQSAVVITAYDKVRYNFDEEGKLISINGVQTNEWYQNVERDEQGRISAYTEGEYDMVSSFKLVYGKNGFLEKRITNDMGECVTTYTYNEAGFLTSDHLLGEYTEMGADKPEKVDVKTTYKYTGIDDHGNWTRRETVPADDTEGPVYEARSIMYYD